MPKLPKNPDFAQIAFRVAQTATGSIPPEGKPLFALASARRKPAKPKRAKKGSKPK